MAGVRVGTVKDVKLRADNTALVSFDADKDVVLTTGTRAAVRYLNLVGDRYLELARRPRTHPGHASRLADPARNAPSRRSISICCSVASNR